MNHAAPLGQSSRYRVALAGNPNSGKTSIFNALTGLKYKVANYPGVTVEKKEGYMPLPGLGGAVAIDLPGIYSLAGTSVDEVIATQALFGQLESEPLPDVIISVVDASNLERNLYLTTQLIDLGIPVVLALNMSDIAEKKGISIKNELLSRELDVPVISIVATKGCGIQELSASVGMALISLRSSRKRLAWLPAGLAEPYAAAADKLSASPDSGISSRAPGSTFLIGSSLLSGALAGSTMELVTTVGQAQEQLHLLGIDCSSFEATARYRWIEDLIRRCCHIEARPRTGIAPRIEKLTTHKVWGLIIFAAIMLVMFQAIFLWASLPMDLIDSMFASLGQWIHSSMAPGELRSLIVDGVVAGVGSVVIFIPQIAILFLFIGLLEDSGYLAHAAFLMDRTMRRFGLQGRSFVPLLSSFACAIPGILATRTIPSLPDRIATILVAPLMSCSARLPVYAVLIAASVPATYLAGYFSLQGLVLFAMYALGVLGAIVVARLLRFSLLRGEPALFVMELPPLRAPSLLLVLRNVLDRILIFIKSAGTVILACSVVLWFLASYPAGDTKHSYAGQIGTFIEPVIKPLGYNWEIGVAILGSFAAREVFVSSLSTVYNLADSEGAGQSLISLLRDKTAAGEFGLATALSLMVFYVFACQCISTLAVCKRETGSWGWTAFMFGYMTVLAYAAAFVTFRVALLLLPPGI